MHVYVSTYVPDIHTSHVSVICIYKYLHMHIAQ